jgi:hypothetical protein
MHWFFAALFTFYLRAGSEETWFYSVQNLAMRMITVKALLGALNHLAEISR